MAPNNLALSSEILRGVCPEQRRRAQNDSRTTILRSLVVFSMRQGAGDECPVHIKAPDVRHTLRIRSFVAMDTGRGDLPSGSVNIYFCAIWIRLPQVSSNTAMVTGPFWVGGIVNTTPSFFSLSCSF